MTDEEREDHREHMEDCCRCGLCGSISGCECDPDRCSACHEYAFECTCGDEEEDEAEAQSSADARKEANFKALNTLVCGVISDRLATASNGRKV